jgi:protein-S-isoprenylcysteine O-methyltransferase Ste14
MANSGYSRQRDAAEFISSRKSALRENTCGHGRTPDSPEAGDRDCPPSATHPAVATAGLAAFLASVAALYAVPGLQGIGAAGAALATILVTAAAINLTDIVLARAHLRLSTGIDYSCDDPSLARTGCKLVGLGASLGLVGVFYWLAPEYHDAFYGPFYGLLAIVMPIWLLLALPYFYFVDRHMRDPHDGYWHLGRAAMLRFEDVDRGTIIQHLLGWLVKGFFLPLMFVYFCNGLDNLLALDIRTLMSFPHWYEFLYGLVFLVDVGLASMGYLLALRVMDTHLRSAEPTLLGWLVAVICYEPFVALVSLHYLAYSGGLVWGDWLAGSPVLYVLWGTTILGLVIIYGWSTVMFGGRFSNLTHRGIITSGPYRWTRHPAYLAKNLSWWMISVPFISQGSPGEAVRSCLLLLALNGVYWLRAKTEERHLSRDPVYRQYSRYIDRHGLFRSLRRISPAREQTE